MDREGVNLTSGGRKRVNLDAHEHAKRTRKASLLPSGTVLSLLQFHALRHLDMSASITPAIVHPWCE